MKHLKRETSAKLQNILSKRLGRNLTQEELEQAYEALMGFAEALLDLNSEEQTSNSGENSYNISERHIAIIKSIDVRC